MTGEGTTRLQGATKSRHLATKSKVFTAIELWTGNRLDNATGLTAFVH